MFDWLITGARIVDGGGTPSFLGDAAIAGGRIAAVGSLSHLPAAHTLDAAGRVLCPGFVDIHRHGDAALFRPEYGKAELAQGITSVVNGNCGLSAAPAEGPHAPELRRYLAPIVGELPPEGSFASVAACLGAAQAVPLRISAGMLAGGGTLRACAAGLGDGPLSPEQLRSLHAALERALGDGALGVSLGLGYAPECFYTTAQLIEALAPLRDSGTVLTVHMRQEGDGVTEALREMLEVARGLRTPVEISHLKAIGRRNWRRAVPEMLRLLARAREEGTDVTCDVYPYTAGSTQLLHVLPPEAQAGGLEALGEKLRSPAGRAALRRRLETGEDFENIVLLVGFDNILAGGLRCPEDRPFEGRSLAQLAQARGQDPFDALFDLLAREACGPSMIDFIAAEEDIADILHAPFSSVISDATYPAGGRLHPRVYGMTARLLTRFVEQTHTLTLEEAVNRLTRRPADRLGLKGKGRLEAGADADLVLFRPEDVREEGTYQEPEQYARGFSWVFVNGVPAVAEGRFTDAFAGRVLRR
jgi:N-acyl-D-aspartate/D-glutamate deacylase